jgi:hypothetical protein
VAIERESSTRSDFLTAFIDFVLSEDPRKWLIAIVLIGFILRLVVVAHNTPVADEMVHGSHALGVSKSGVLSTMTQGPVWFYLTDIGYRIFGVHLWVGRGVALLFGSLSIVALFLVVNQIYGSRPGLIAAFIFAVSPYQLLWSRIYMDQGLLFFILLAAYFFIKEYRQRNYVGPIVALFLGIGALIKIIAGVFGLVFGIFAAYLVYTNRSDSALFKESLKNLFYFVLTILICLTPLLAHNYFLYKEKGLVDLPFAMYLGVNTEFYQGPGLAHGKGFMISSLPTNLGSVAFHYFLKQDSLAFILALIGLVPFCNHFRKFRFEKIFLVSLFGFALLFIASTIVLDTHYIYFTVLFALIAAPFIDTLGQRIKKPYSTKIFMAFFVSLLVINLFMVKDTLLTKSATEKLREFAQSKIDKDSLVIADSRIYRGNVVWALYNTNYVDAGLATQLLEYGVNSSKNLRPLTVYFVECSIDDCGWGTIKDQPDLNKSMESMASVFKQATQETTFIEGGGSKKDGYDDEGLVQFTIYKVTIKSNPAILDIADQTHQFFFYNIPRDKNPAAAYDFYKVRGFMDILLNSLAKAILWALILGALVSGAYVIYRAYLTK